jgi:hypothetical protein
MIGNYLLMMTLISILSSTLLNAGSLHYSIEAFYMVKLDGDESYEKLKAKVNTGEPLTKQDLMSIVFLPLMKNSVDKGTRLACE